ncbi:MAG: SDR family NAD(P)-dependent oxidoreductase [Gammaproteobacteria bacterium]|nr:SDR family NAD(P)-dependent oxidoreductase [Gammaproteobacteria bacterium]
MQLAQLKKIINFYGRCAASFSQIGFVARGLPRRSFDADFSEQLWLVTGASGGIGSEIVAAAARRGARVCAVARNRQKLEAMRATLSAEADRVEPFIVDLSLQRDVSRLLGELAAAGKRVDVLVNCVGVLLDEFSLNSEGRETSFATNLLNHYLLTEGLVRGRGFANRGLVINISSGGMYNVPLSTKMLHVLDPQQYNGTAAYGFAKRAQLALSALWEKNHASSGVHSYVMHPGWVDTDGVRRSLPRFRRILKSVLRKEPAGADTVIWLAATRPAVPLEDHVWFDRKSRPAHIFAHTRTSADSPASLAAWLEDELAKFPDALPWAVTETVPRTAWQ